MPSVGVALDLAVGEHVVLEGHLAVSLVHRGSGGLEKFRMTVGLLQEDIGLWSIMVAF